MCLDVSLRWHLPGDASAGLHLQTVPTHKALCVRAAYQIAGRGCARRRAWTPGPPPRRPPSGGVAARRGQAGGFRRGPDERGASLPCTSELDQSPEPNQPWSPNSGDMRHITAKNLRQIFPKATYKQRQRRYEEGKVEGKNGISGGRFCQGLVEASSDRRQQRSQTFLGCLASRGMFRSPSRDPPRQLLSGPYSPFQISDQRF